MRKSKCVKMRQNASKYFCELCDYSTSRKTDYQRHLSSKKHFEMCKSKVSQNVSQNASKVANIGQNSENIGKKVKKMYICEHCNKEYVHRQSLYSHKKKCKKIPKSEDTMKLKLQLEEHKLELEEHKLELAHQKGKNEAYETLINNGKINNITNNTTNNNNITLNVFLNDYCKDAVNLEDFMKGIKFKLKDVLNDGNYIEDCVSVKLLNDLNDMPVTKRPIHCTDKRRKNFVVKDKEEGWITEKGNQSGKMSKHINNLYGKAYIDFYHEYDEEHPLPHSNRQVDEKSETSSKIMQKKDKHYIIGTLAKNLDVKEAIKEVADK